MDGAQHGTHERVLHRGIDQHVVRGNTRLAGVEELRPRDPSRGDVDVGVGGHDRGALATQLERHRGEVLGRSGHDDAADRAVAGVEDVVELLTEQLGRLIDAPGDDLHDGGVEVLRDELGHQRRCGRRDLRRLEHHGVASCDGRHQGSEQQLEGVVPRRDDQHNPKWLGHDLRRTRLEGELHLHPLGRTPGVDVLDRRLDLAQHQPDLSCVRLHRGLAEVRGHRPQDRLLLLHQHALQLAELRAPGLQITQHTTPLGGTQILHDFRNADGVGGLVAHVARLCQWGWQVGQK